MRRPVSLGAVLFVVCFAATAAAQESVEETAALSRGFHAEKVYDLLGLDTVERFSGDLILRIPLGQEYHNGRVSYQFVLHYNSHFWDYVTPPDTLPPPPHCQFPSILLSFPSGDFNAGLGWLLTLGKFGCSPGENGVMPASAALLSTTSAPAFAAATSFC